MLTAFLAAKGWLGLKNQWWLLVSGTAAGMKY